MTRWSELTKRLLGYQVMHRDCVCANPVGASLLAKIVNDDACILNERGALELFASRLAPTVGLTKE